MTLIQQLKNSIKIRLFWFSMMIPPSRVSTIQKYGLFFLKPLKKIFLICKKRPSQLALHFHKMLENS
ncbi:hypothetical protein CUJ86_07985 [Methanofollis fontis]|uniref:Uncharacterized protein n=1 Tax=Methanofollis fontis TaxID=2052832 RepID=A0A483CM58_9EURY|nr:hypothetical protein CUJ86_07985 [Methanofollis fontis]